MNQPLLMAMFTVQTDTIIYIFCRVFTFGIGSGASTALVNGLAKAGNGTAEFIKEGERMQPKVRTYVHDMLTTYLT